MSLLFAVNGLVGILIAIMIELFMNLGTPNFKLRSEINIISFNIFISKYTGM